MNEAQQLASMLIEGTPEEEAKAQEMIAKWDRVYASHTELAKLKRKSIEAFDKMGVSIGLNRELARLRLKWDDVEHFLRGEQVGAVDNYKRETPAKICRDRYCAVGSKGGIAQQAKPQPMEAEQCATCGGPLETITRRTTPSELRSKLAKHYVGAELKNGRRVWFQNPVPPKTHQWGTD